MPIKGSIKSRDLVEWKEIEPLLNLLSNHGIGDSQAYNRIGYKNSSGTLQDRRRLGLAPRLDFYGLKGLIAELKLETIPAAKTFSLDFEDSELVFDALRKAREVWPKRADKLKGLQARVAAHMVEF